MASEEKIWDLINAAGERMTVPQARFWEAIRIEPEKWEQHPYGDRDQGFWAVAILGRIVVWHNSIEGGFNRSRYSHSGTIGEYFANQSLLEDVVQELITIIKTGYDIGGQSGPPIPGPRRP